MHKNRIKALEDMCLMDRFLFAEYAAKKENLELLLQIILGDDNLRLTDEVQAEREFRSMPDKKQIRMDVYARDEMGQAYDMEPQGHNSDNILKRSRYYQGMLDTNLLETSHDYKQLPNSFIIFICDFDLLGEGLFIYTCGTACKENGQVVDDGATRIFINTKGDRQKQQVSDELIELLRLFDKKSQVQREELHSARVRDIRGRMEQIKKDKEVGMRYFMMLDEKKEYAEEVTKELQDKIHVLHVKTEALQEKNNALSTKMYTIILSMCREMNLDKAETVHRLETQASMTHEDAVKFVASAWE